MVAIASCASATANSPLTLGHLVLCLRSFDSSVLAYARTVFVYCGWIVDLMCGSGFASSNSRRRIRSEVRRTCLADAHRLL